MLKNKIINKIISVVILSILLISILPINVIKAEAASNLLISVGTGSYSITVTTSTTVNDIIKVLGQPKLKTVSAFGGNAYAFYTDSNYSNYLYIETTANDKEIFSYGSVVPSYKTGTYSYGDKYNYQENGVFHGCLLNEDGKVHGGIYYNKTVSDFFSLIDTFKENFKSNETYRKSAAMQGIVMYNALSVVQGQPANLVFDEDLYKYNEDLKKQGTSLREVREHVPYEYTELIKTRENIGIQNSIYYVFNPMMYASMAMASTNEDLGDKKFALFDYDIDSKILFATAVNSDFKNALKSNSIAESMVDEETPKVESSILYALSLLDDKMTDADKAQILAQYVQEGNDYSMKDAWRGYKWMLLNHAGVCEDFADTCRALLNRAGILCEKASSEKANHAWNICSLDNNWCYVDTTKGGGRSTGAKSTASPYGFYGKTRFNKYSSMYQNFVDATSIDNLYNPLPEGKDAEITNVDSRIYYDETYKYYLQDSVAGKQEGLFRENRTTGEKKLLTDKVLVNHSYDGDGNIVKQGTKIYFVGDDAKQVKSISTNGTNEKQEFKLNTANEEISGIYVQDGYIWYIKFNTSTKKDEYVKYKQISDYPTIGTYTLNDSKHKFSLKYIQNSKGIVITQCIGIGNYLPQGEIYIPNTINGKPVVGIGEKAFGGACGLLTGTLVLPENLEFIGDRGFQGCKNITGIQFNNKLNSIGLYAFSNNDKVKNITLPDSLTYMNNYAFFNCNSLTNVNLGKGLQIIHNSIFEDCISLKQITFPSTVKRIGEYALKGTTSLKNVIIESKEIEKMGFYSGNYDIYLYGGTTTSNYADANNIKYKDLRTNKPILEKPSLEKPTLSIDKNMLQINNLTERPKITATLSDGSNPNITWTSKNKNIATVSNGIITPKAGGFTNIEAYDANAKNQKVSCWVYVCALRTLSDGSKAYPGDLTRDGVINGSDSSIILGWYNKNLTLTEDEIAVGDLDGDGTVDGTDSSFILDIYNKSIPFIPGKYNPVTNVTLSKTAITLAKAGNTETITARYTPTDTTDSPNVIWSTSNSKVATVVNGKITAIAPGTANITATVGTKSATCKVTIPTPTISLIGISLNKTTLTLEKGKSEPLTVTYNPNNTTQSKTVTWKSSNSKVATVVNGKITAIAPGTATITATVGNKSATCNVTVKQSVISLIGINLNKTTLKLQKGKSETLIVIYNPNNTTQSKTVTWKSSNSKVATVVNGKITAVAPGTATITATVGTKSATCTVTVPTPTISLIGISLNKITLTLEKGKSETLIVTYNPNNTTQSKTVTWKSSNSKVATVVNGKIIAIAPGTATITATVGNKSATCNVTVKQPVISLIGISLNKTTLTLQKGKSETLTVTYNPNNTTESKTVTWKSSNSKVATVVNGKITAIAPGTATITATVKGRNATCKVTVPKEQETNPAKPTEPTKPEIDYTLGDVNEDESIDEQDAVMILKHVAHNITLNEAQMLAADTNKDGNVDVGDAVQILKYVAHNITEF